MSLLDALGLDPDTRAIILSCENVGTSHAATVGAYQVMREGSATTGEIVVPGPWSRFAAAEFRGEDLGVNLTLTAEHDLVRWGPITSAPSLLGGEGGFPRTIGDAWEHADIDEVRRECRAQLERAIYWGFDVTHLASRDGVLTMRPEFFDVVLDLAIEFDLPVRLGDAHAERAAGFPFRTLAANEGVLTPDRVVPAHESLDEAAFHAALTALPAGVTEFVFRPAVETPELQALTPEWERHEEQHHMLWCDDTANAIDAAHVTLSTYRELRTAQRSARA